MGLSVMAFLVGTGKMNTLHQMLADLNGSRRAQTEEVHRRAGVHERGYLQALPDGSALYLAAFESDDAATALQRVMEANASDAEYGAWIFSQLQSIFGMDPSQGIPPLPEQVYDSGSL